MERNTRTVPQQDGGDFVMAYRAFVSSTFEDLKDHRSHVITALRKAGFSVDPMEDWTAAASEPKHFSQERVQGCDLIILLLAFRRGHVPDGEKYSITQLEYQAALALGTDVLVFMLDEKAPWPRRFDDLDKDPEMKRWRAELMERKGVSFFSLDPQSIEVGPALTRWIEEKGIKGGAHRGFDVPRSLSTVDRKDLRFGISLGWQLGRYEFVYGPDFPEARAAHPSIEAEISSALSQDAFPHSVLEMNYQRLVGSVLSYYGMTSLGKHAAILVGIAGMRVSLVGSSTNKTHNAEMERLGFSAIEEIDPMILNDKRRFYKALLERKPKAVVEVLEVIDSFGKSAKESA